MKYSEVAALAAELQRALNEGLAPFTTSDPKVVFKIFETDSVRTVRFWALNTESQIKDKKNVVCNGRKNLMKQAVSFLEQSPVSSKNMLSEIASHAVGVQVLVQPRKIGYAIVIDGKSSYVATVEAAMVKLDELSSSKS